MKSMKSMKRNFQLETPATTLEKENISDLLIQRLAYEPGVKQISAIVICFKFLLKNY